MESIFSPNKKISHCYRSSRSRAMLYKEILPPNWREILLISSNRQSCHLMRLFVEIWWSGETDADIRRRKKINEVTSF